MTAVIKSGIDRVQAIRRTLGRTTMIWEPTEWLPTKSRALNGVLGREDKGIPFGKLIELFGPESHGKSSVAWDVAAIAQAQGCSVVCQDLELSYEPEWAQQRGCDPRRVNLIQPYLGTFKGEKKPRLSTIQELCTEVETIVLQNKARNRKTVVIVDSVAAMLTEIEATAGLEKLSMRTQTSLSLFLPALCRKWAPLAKSCHAIFIFVNQMRTNPGIRFGNPEYTPGGRALKHFCHIRARVRRVKNGKILQKGKQVGIVGVITNVKNKVGGLEASKAGYKILFHGPSSYATVKAAQEEIE